MVEEGAFGFTERCAFARLGGRSLGWEGGDARSEKAPEKFWDQKQVSGASGDNIKYTSLTYHVP